jgi:hypothetical protein
MCAQTISQSLGGSVRRASCAVSLKMHRTDIGIDRVLVETDAVDIRASVADIRADRADDAMNHARIRAGSVSAAVSRSSIAADR